MLLRRLRLRHTCACDKMFAILMIFYHSRVRQKVFALPINKATETFQTDFSKVCTLKEGTTNVQWYNNEHKDQEHKLTGWLGLVRLVVSVRGRPLLVPELLLPVGTKMSELQRSQEAPTVAG